MRKCLLIKAGRVDYAAGLALQGRARQAVAAGNWDGSLLLLEHAPVITIGRGGGAENVCVEREELAAQGVAVTETDRGGNVTCHNPGQIVGYPILNLVKWQQDVHWYVEMLEEALIRTLACHGLRAGRKARYTGVWLGNEKIAAIGVSVKQWLTGHGFALNVANDLSLFQAIVPCGIREFGVTSMVRAGIDVTPAEVTETISREFGQVFACDWIEKNDFLQC